MEYTAPPLKVTVSLHNQKKNESYRYKHKSLKAIPSNRSMSPNTHTGSDMTSDNCKKYCSKQEKAFQEIQKKPHQKQTQN
jgi:hypothetical protein